MSSTSSRKSRNYGVLLAAYGLGAAGCASQSPQPALENVPELTAVPFFPQSEFDCGPAALATILNWANVAVAPEELIDAVYIEGLKGSLQAELLAATRRYGLLPVPIPQDPASLLAEVESGRPVLVLQNLAFKRVPAWHYAVVVGYDAAAERFVNRGRVQGMQRTACSITIGRGMTTRLDDLVAALRAGEIAGAGLDVFEQEPLPADHPLWTMPGVLITPHTAGHGPFLDDRRLEVLLDNCRRFLGGQPLRNVVDKANWF